ncbi:extracellular solute-binding protein [Paenibacillus flagellatus]|uniref:extracellular solute-binding protein n=1 Tax=Paenibacillus flagellatus TaxID=2211139 RepID=UPI0013051F13|nr:extracellular solute-binding protein [Paenibacillus flagellatus]
MGLGKGWNKGIGYGTVTALLAVFLAGCSNDPGTEGEGNPSSGKDGSGSTKPVELTLMAFESAEVAKSDDDPIYKALQEKLNIRLKVVSSPFNNYNDKLNVMIASGELADLFYGDGIGNLEQFHTWIEEEIVLPMSDRSAGYPNLDKALKRFDMYKAATGGKHYGLPITSYSDIDKPVYNDHTMWIRKDWLDKLHLQVPTTIDEFYQVAKAFAEQDPDGNNKADTYGYGSSDGSWWFYPILNAFGTSQDRYKKVDGKWVPEVIQPETKEALAFLKKLYDEKIMDPEFMINNGEQLIEKFVAGKVGIIFKNGSMFYNTFYDKFEKAYPGRDPKSMFVAGGVMKGKSGAKRLDGFGNFWMTTLINNQIGEEKKKKALELLDYLASDEGMRLMRWGVEGRHYRKEGDKFVSLVEKDENGVQKTLAKVAPTARLKTLITWDNGFVPENTRNREEVIKAGREGIENANVDPLFGMVIDPKALPPELTKTLGDYVEETFVQTIARSKQFDADWEKFVKTWLSKGGQKAWDETNKKALEEGR